MENRKLVYTTKHEHNVTMMKDKLSAAGCDVMILDQHDSITQVVGSFELHVLNEDFDKAKALVDSMRK